jgi:DNA mismatch endonuclease, patch repair protein
VLRRALHARGARYRLHRVVADKVTADIVFPRQRVAVFVDGCFWHGCPVHGRTAIVSTRGPNASKWAAKLARIQERDRRATRLAEEAGWHVLRLWECEVNNNPDAAVEIVLSAVNGSTSVADQSKAPFPDSPIT